jgi:hypothetical protein
VECAGVRAIVPVLQLVQKLWLTLLHCGMCRVQTIVPIFRLVQNFWLTLLRCGMCRVQAIVPIFRLVDFFWLTLLRCGMCQVQAIVPIFAACSKTLAHLITLRNMLGYRPLWPVLQLVQKTLSHLITLWNVLGYRPLCLFLQLVQKTLAHLTYHRPNSSQARAQWPVPGTFHNMISTGLRTMYVHMLLQEQVSSRGATTTHTLTGSGRKLERER